MVTVPPARTLCADAHAKADMNRASSVGVTPVFAAARAGNAEVLSFLLKAKADVAVEGAAWSPLVAEAAAGKTRAVKILLKHAPHLARLATAGVREWQGRTIRSGTLPLQVALEFGCHGAAERIRQQMVHP